MVRGLKEYWTARAPRPTLEFDAAGATLRIDVTRAGGELSAGLRRNVVRRVLLALSRFGPQLRKVSVRLAEPANPLGGVDQRCRMRAWLQHRDGIHAEAINGGFEAAVTRAAGRIAERVDFALDEGAGGGAHARAPTQRRRGRRSLEMKVTGCR
jgi:hypothetical protein